MTFLFNLCAYITDISLFLATLGVLFSDGMIPSWLTYLLAIAVYSLIHHVKLSRNVRICFTSLFALLFLLRPSFSTFFYVTPLVLVTLLHLEDRIHPVSYDAVMDHLKFGGAAFFLTSFLVMLLSSGKPADYYVAALPYALVWGWLSVFLLRMLRNTDPAGLGMRYFMINFLLAVLFALGSMFLLSDTFQNIVLFLLVEILRYLIIPVFVLFARIFSWIFLLLQRLAAMIFPYIDFNLDVAGFEEGALDWSVMESDSTEVQDIPQWLIYNGRFVLIILFILLAVWILHRITREKRSVSKTSVLEREKIVEKRGNTGLFRRYGRGTRAMFRRFLDLCRRNYVEIRPSDDTKTIVERAAYETGAMSAEKLRDLYLPVRYGDKKDTYEKEARDLYRQIREEMDRSPE